MNKTYGKLKQSGKKKAVVFKMKMTLKSIKKIGISQYSELKIVKWLTKTIPFCANSFTSISHSKFSKIERRASNVSNSFVNISTLYRSVPLKTKATYAE